MGYRFSELIPFVDMNGQPLNQDADIFFKFNDNNIDFSPSGAVVSLSNGIKLTKYELKEFKTFLRLIDPVYSDE